MITNTLLQHLENKQELSSLESSTLNALNDESFIAEYVNLEFLRADNEYRNALSNPGSLERSYNYRYINLLVKISSTYRAYLYEQKYKFTSATKQILDVKNSVTESENSINEKLEALNESISNSKVEYEKIFQQFSDKVDDAQSDIDHIKGISESLSGEEILNVYANEFETRSKKYETISEGWRNKLYISFVVGSLFIISLFFISIVDVDYLAEYFASDITFSIYALTISIKLMFALGIIQGIRFFNRNYNANKHLEYQSLHKRDVLKALVGVYKNIDDTNMKDELLRSGALIAFQNTESGFISKKEGAGNTSDNAVSILNTILTKN